MSKKKQLELTPQMLVDMLPHLYRVNARKAYAIRWVKEFPLQDRHGETDPSNRAVHLRVGNNVLVTASTLLHELLHVWSIESGASVTESQVLKLEKQFVNLFRLNKDLVRQLLEIL